MINYDFPIYINAREEDATKITNTSGIHKHAHLVFPAELEGDFTFTIELMGSYELSC